MRRIIIKKDEDEIISDKISIADLMYKWQLKQYMDGIIAPLIQELVKDENDFMCTDQSSR